MHGANIISGNGGCVKLVDFDWGGTDGKLSYPTPKLTQELFDGRSSEGLIITKADDSRTLNQTSGKTLANSHGVFSFTVRWSIHSL